VRGRLIRDTVLIALFAAVIAVCSFVSIPFGIVPVTMQGLGVFSALFILGGRRGSLATLAYTLIGAIGLPVFSGFTGGIGRLFDATGGYIVGFLAGSLVYLLITSIFGERLLVKIIGAIAVQAVVYTLGALWFALGYSEGHSFFEVLLITVIPFVIPDAIKLILAFIISEKLKNKVNI